jgi:hypothetical protein
MELPSIFKAVSSERFGPHRSINHGITYDCVGENMWVVGPPFAFCRSPGLWDAMFKCKELSKYDTLTTRTRVKILSFLCGF